MNFTQAQWIALLPLLITGASPVVVMAAISIKRHHWWNATLGVSVLNIALLACAALLLGPMFGLLPPFQPQQITPLLLVDGYALFIWR